MGRPPRFTREQVQQAALALVDRKGLAGLSMRNLAAALGTGAMTLYTYAADRETLELLVVEAVLGGLHWQVRGGASWRETVHAVAAASWQAMRAHPHALPLILTRRSRSPAAIGAAEALLDALAGGGLTGPMLLVGLRTITAFVVGFSQAELAGPLALQAGESAEQTIERFRALPPARYPWLVQTAAAAIHSDPEWEFRAGLEAILDGLAPAKMSISG